MTSSVYFQNEILRREGVADQKTKKEEMGLVIMRLS